MLILSMVGTLQKQELSIILAKSPRHLLIDEIDKMARQNQTFLLNLMETGMFLKLSLGE
jgi:replication-associated recombination protein RarA